MLSEIIQSPKGNITIDMLVINAPFGYLQCGYHFHRSMFEVDLVAEWTRIEVMYIVLLTLRSSQDNTG